MVSNPKVALAMLDRASGIPDDPRYDAATRANARAQRAALRAYLAGEAPLIEVDASSRRVAITPTRHVILVEDGWEPVAAHTWMDRAAGTGLAEAEYRRLAGEERMRLGVRAALERAFDGYAGRWLTTYWPEVHDRLWWDEGGSGLAWEDPDAARALFAAEAAKLRLTVA